MKEVTITIPDRETLGGIILAINYYVVNRKLTLEPQVAKNLDKMMEQLSDKFLAWETRDTKS